MLTLHETRVRANPLLELKPLGDLAAAQREPFLELERDPDFYGLLVPKPPLTMNLKSVARQVAELFRSLATPSPVDESDDVVDLILDGVLEIESGDGFVSGADALAIIAPPLPEPHLADAAARLSRDALLHAQDLATSEPQALTNALYLYNRIPLSPFWKTRFANREAVLAYLGADHGPLAAALERDWIAGDPSHAKGWIHWASRERARRGPDDVTYKLYVSPRPERIRDAFHVVVRVLGAFPGAQFKIGHDAAGLLRPDKLVTYFVSREQLDEAAAALRRELAGCDAQGVPFTAGLDDSGLLSWGIDPPENDRALAWLGRESWRLWVAQRLATALSVGKAARSAAAAEPWRFAVERVRRLGVDVDTWTPSAALWSAA